MCHSIIRGFPTWLGTYMSHKFRVIKTLEPVGKIHISSLERRFCVSDFLMNFGPFAKYIWKRNIVSNFSFKKIKIHPKSKIKNKIVQNRHNYPPNERVLNIVLLSYLVIAKFG
jgi:hypothetical protein